MQRNEPQAQSASHSLFPKEFRNRGLEAGTLGRGTHKKAIFFSLVFPSPMPWGGGGGLGRGWKLLPFDKSGGVLPVQGRLLPPSGLYLFLWLRENQPLMCQLFIHQNCQTLWISSPQLWLAHSKTLTFSKFCNCRRKGKLQRTRLQLTL